MFFECNANPPSFGLWRVGPTGGSRLACKRQRWPWQAWPPWTPPAPVALGAALHPRLGHRRGSPGSRRDMARSQVGTHGLGDPPRPLTTGVARQTPPPLFRCVLRLL